MAVTTPTQNPYTFTPTGNATVRPLFSLISSKRPCQADAECPASEFCNFDDTTFASSGDSTNQFGVCTPIPNTTLTTEVSTPNSGQIQVQGEVVGRINRFVTVRATPNVGYTFVKWNLFKRGLKLEQEPTGTALDLVMDDNIKVVAIFEQTLTTLTTEITPSNSGAINVFGNLVGPLTRIVTITAAPENGFEFVNWNITANGVPLPQQPTSNTLDVVMDVNKTVRANFRQRTQQSSLTITANPATVTLRKASSVVVPLTVNTTNVTNVTLSVSGLPTAITHTFTGLNSVTFSNSGQTTGPITATITATGTSITGQTITATATVTIRGTYITRLVPSPASNGQVSTSAQRVPPDPVTGIIEIESTQEESGTAGTITFTATPNGSSYTFVGWFLDSNLTTPWSQVALQDRIPVTQNRTYTAKFIPAGGTGVCTPPPISERERTVPVSCPTGQVGTASQRQIRTYNAAVSGSGTCPFTSDWQNSGQPDYSQCTTQQFWRNCVTGQQVEGTPPTGYISKQFTGTAGGICWEQPGDIDFIPSLAQALQFTYQRGTSRYPETRTVDIINRSESFVQQVTIQTNSKVNLAVGTSTGAGSISFNIPPRGSVTLRVSVTPQLLQELQDGVSTLGMSIQYQAVN